MHHEPPLVEPHLHHDTAITPQNIYDVGLEIDMPAFRGKTVEEIARMVEAPVPDTNLSPAERWKIWYDAFNNKRLAYVSPEAIRRLVEEVIIDAQIDRVNILELRVSLLSSVDALMKNLGCYPQTPPEQWTAEEKTKYWKFAEQVFEEILQGINNISRDGIETDLLVSVSCQRKYRDLVAPLMDFCRGYRKHIVGLDLTNEREIDPGKLAREIESLRQDVNFLTVHCMELNGPDIGWRVLETLNPDRIGHGVRMVEDPHLVEAFATRGTPCEICLVSNHVTGTVMELSGHPMRRMFTAGVPLMIGSDVRDADSTLSGNYGIIEKVFRFKPKQMARFRENGWIYAARNLKRSEQDERESA